MLALVVGSAVTHTSRLEQEPSQSVNRGQRRSHCWKPDRGPHKLQGSSELGATGAGLACALGLADSRF